MPADPPGADVASPSGGSARGRAVTATLWNGAEAVSRQLVQLASAMILARLLTPEDFGTVALLALVLGFAYVLADAGFSLALIQRRGITPAHEASAFWVMLALGVIGTGLLVLVSPWLAGFYGEPDVEPLLRVMALTVLFTAVGAVPSALIQRRLQFRRLFLANITGAVVAATIAIVGAAHGWGVWALAAQSVTMTVVTAVLYFACAGWWPRARSSVAATRELASFGGFMLATSLLEETYTRAYTVLIGRWYGTRELGFYSRATSTQQIPVAALGGVVGRVGLPFFSSIADDVARLRTGVRVALRGLMLVNLPMMLGLAAIAQPATRALFGPQWGPSVPILQVLCLAGCLWPIQVVNLTALLAQGHAKLLFRLEVVKKSVGVALLVLGSLGGVMGIAWASVAFALVASVVNVHYTERLIGYGLVRQARDIAPLLGVSLLMAAIVWLLQGAWHPAAWVELLGLGLAGVVIFLALARLLRLEALDDAWRLLRGQRLSISDAAA